MCAYLLDQFDLTEVHDLGDQLQVVAVGRGAQQAQALLPHALEAIRAAARLEGASAQDLGAGALHRDGAGFDLLLALGRARTGHDDHLVAAYPHVIDHDDGVVGLERAAGQLVRLGDAVHLLDAVEDFEQRNVELARSADRAENRPQRAGGPVDVEAHFRQLRDDRLDLGV